MKLPSACDVTEFRSAAANVEEKIIEKVNNLVQLAVYFQPVQLLHC